MRGHLKEVVQLFTGIFLAMGAIFESLILAAFLQPFVYGAPGEIRTPDHLVRSQVLYPAELRAHKRGRIIQKCAYTVNKFPGNHMAEREGLHRPNGACPAGWPSAIQNGYAVLSNPIH